MYFRLNVPDIVHETVDGEIIVMNLQSGDYYSLVGSGADIWTLAVEGTPTEMIANRLADGVIGDSFIATEVQSFLHQLVGERLIVPVTDGLLHLNGEQGETRKTNEVVRKPFVSPKIDKYSDMQGLLLVDPIHEVDATGWPATDPARL